MENNINITSEKTLKDYQEILNEFLDGKNIKSIAKDLNLSEKTIYNYISGQIPDSIAGKAISNAILEKSMIIINEKKEKLNSI